MTNSTSNRSDFVSEIGHRILTLPKEQRMKIFVFLSVAVYLTFMLPVFTDQLAKLFAFIMLLPGMPFIYFYGKQMIPYKGNESKLSDTRTGWLTLIGVLALPVLAMEAILFVL